MIRNIAEMLEKFRIAEKEKLDTYNLSHPPTIGYMYEGLTKEILSKTIPEGINLKIVSGFIHDGKTYLSNEIDCMLVEGEGEKIPYVEKYKWHISNVIAVLEVKKTLYTKEMVDSFKLLGDIAKNYGEYMSSNASKEKIRINSVVKTFEQITEVKYPGQDFVKDLPFNLQLIFHCLMVELISPIRIVFGYDGFQREENFRDSLCDFLSKNIGTLGYGPSSFPHLIISGKFSLVKANGQPFVIRHSHNRWPFLASTRCNPLVLILEFILTRLDRMGILQEDVWGDDLIQQNLNALLFADPTTDINNPGWNYVKISKGENELKKEPPEKNWEPHYVTQIQAVIFHQLCAGKIVRVDDADLLKYLASNNEDINSVLDPLFEKGLILLDGKEIKLITEGLACVILPTGEFVVAENNSGRLTNWVAKQAKNK